MVEVMDNVQTMQGAPVEHRANSEPETGVAKPKRGLGRPRAPYVGKEDDPYNEAHRHTREMRSAERLQAKLAEAVSELPPKRRALAAMVFAHRLCEEARRVA